MEKSIVVEGKTSTEALEKGLKILNCKKEDVEIKIIENEEKRSFYSILEPRVVKIELKLKEKSLNNKEVSKQKVTEDDIKICNKELNEYLEKFFENIEDTTYNINQNEDEITVNILGEGAKYFIGYRGETIKSLQTIFSLVGNKNTENRVRVTVDAENYNEKREETLKELAKKLEKTVKRTGKTVILEPMSAYERKIIHSALQDSEFVNTYSIGEEPRRKVVIEKTNNK